MPAKPESKFWKQLKDGTADLDVLWTRIESWASPGVPDLFGVYQGHSFWLELKVSRLKTVKYVDLSPQQILWQTLHCQAGANVWNLVEHPSSSAIKLFNGTRAIELGREKERTKELEPCWECPRKYDWKRMLSTITGKTRREED